ncbi:protein kinase [Hoyosella sp. YIM 151337]|uniref:protein kinase domain-containing protein n=1 Tax=Hoyosella sp. YIM 151337 TaxID=2992742 RepID=UPI00223606A4|nr:protein kinase [Hoyosella sp. YIM 151337]MCW4355336.1 protein kinase [Hoyosella sp. YIM 151337]
MDAIEAGQLVAGHYRLAERIGSGGAGVVWRAVDQRLERSVAVKQIPIQPSFTDGERALVQQRAVREARNAARFHHPNAIVVYDITEHEGNPCLVMEYFASRSLAAVLAERRVLPVQQAARIGEQVADALIAAHAAGIVHRDVKPGNILISDQGVAKITDFGISKAMGDVTLTAAGLVSGTAAYLPPEVARGAEPTPASDVFSLGATLFHAIEGEPPYGSGDNSLALLYAAANAETKEPRAAGPATELLRELLSADPADRPSMSQACAALGRLASSGASAATTSRLPQLGTASKGLSRRTGRSVSAVPTKVRPNSGNPRSIGQVSPPAPGRTAERKRTGVYAGLVGVVMLAVFAAVIYAANLAGPGDPTDPEATETIVADAGPTPHTGSAVDWGQAGQLVQQFYSNPAGSWSLLTAAAQQVYGSQQEFQSYWGARTIQSFGLIEAYKHANNDDGSVDMRVNGLTYDGQTKQAILRVVSSDGRLMIDGDTR